MGRKSKESRQNAQPAETPRSESIPEPPTQPDVVPSFEEDADAAEELVAEEKPSVAAIPSEPQSTIEQRLEAIEKGIPQVLQSMNERLAPLYVLADQIKNQKQSPQETPQQGETVQPAASPQGAGLSELLQLLGGGGGGGEDEFTKLAKEQFMKRATAMDRLTDAVVDSILIRKAQVVAQGAS